MVRGLLIRGMVVGLAAGLVAAGFAALFGEPQITNAIAFPKDLWVCSAVITFAMRSAERCANASRRRLCRYSGHPT